MGAGAIAGPMLPLGMSPTRKIGVNKLRKRRKVAKQGKNECVGASQKNARIEKEEREKKNGIRSRRNQAET